MCVLRLLVSMRTQNHQFEGASCFTAVNMLTYLTSIHSLIFLTFLLLLLLLYSIVPLFLLDNR